MHDMAVAFDEKAIGHFHRAGRSHAADIVAAQIEQHQMFGAFFRIGHQFTSESCVLALRGAAFARTGDGTDGHRAIAQTHQDFRARSHNRKAGKGEVIKER